MDKVKPVYPTYNFVEAGGYNEIITKNRSLITLDMNIILGPYKFSLEATVDHHGNSIHFGHYTASVNCCGKTFYCNDRKYKDYVYGRC